MNRTLTIDVYFDVICPWCLIGKRHLDTTLAQLRADQPDIVIEINWHGVQLLPQLPAQGLPFADFYRQRLGSETAVRARQHQVQQAAEAAGVELDLSRIRTMPNTADVHRLFQQAARSASPAQQDTLLERIFAAYFTNGEDLGDGETLRTLSRESGISPAAIEHCLLGDGKPFQGEPGAPAVQSVPGFVFNGIRTLSGAQPVDVLEGAIYRLLSLTDRCGLPA
ncbi:DsbA family oxidoreductase [Marinobacterium rhizophilum]|uniref:DsbA family oxidoreductase n=1 Tax=Marinobacterium rhizophilum TaxID=420402 RepID=A0ABY5HMC2_9GAMM|nr:DsbA family oxidoreductase [Marinobacterium rhizophilum]UTW12380.1 DsbA family oxidoreductase [Marinobacterium rhizophilum]